MKTIVKMPVRATSGGGEAVETEVCLSVEDGQFYLEGDCLEGRLEMPMDNLRQALGIIDPQQSTEPPLNTLVQHLGQKIEKFNQALAIQAATIEGNVANIDALADELKIQNAKANQLWNRVTELEANAKDDGAATGKSFGERVEAAIAPLTDQEFEEDLAG